MSVGRFKMWTPQSEPPIGLCFDPLWTTPEPPVSGHPSDEGPNGGPEGVQKGAH